MTHEGIPLMPRGTLADAWAAAAWHPELLRLTGAAALDPDAPAVARFVAAAEHALGTPWPDLRLSDYARYPRDGDRSAYETTVFDRMDRVTTAAVAAVATGRVEFVDEVADGLYAICEQSTWCWPAHDDVFARTGEVVADPSRPYLDLGAGELAALVSWARLALGDALDARFPGLTRRMGAEVDARILMPFLERRDWHWLGLHGRIHNWNPWIHGNVIVAAAAFADAGKGRAIVDLAVDGIDRYLAALPADGAIDEGFGYWWNGAARALDALEVLDRAAGGSFDVAAVTGLDELLRFPLRSQLGGGWVLGFADAEPRPPEGQPWRIPHHWGRRLGLDDVVAHASGFERAAHVAASPNGGLGRTLSALADVDWGGASAGAPALPASVVFASLRLALARERSGSDAGLAISLKGGHNDENHNHNDLGSVTVTLDGIPAVIDVGRPTTTRAPSAPTATRSGRCGATGTPYPSRAAHSSSREHGGARATCAAATTAASPHGRSTSATRGGSTRSPGSGGPGASGSTAEHPSPKCTTSGRSTSTPTPERRGSCGATSCRPAPPRCASADPSRDRAT